MNYLIFGTIGAALGSVGGYLSRPAFFGMQVPIEVMLSSAPADEAIAEMLMSHMSLWVGGGLIAGGTLALLISQIKRR